MKLTYGYEIEGNFAVSLGNSLDGEFKDDGSVDSIDAPHFQKLYLGETGCYNNHQCTECEGSGQLFDEQLVCENDEPTHTHIPDCYSDVPVECSYCDGNGGFDCDCDLDSEELAREYASEVFSTLDDLLDELKQFTTRKYVWNYSCGLHLHIGTTNRADQLTLAKTLCDYSFQKQLHELALTDMCSHQTYRTNKVTSYCQFWDNRNELIRDLHNHDKYRFMNFHPQGTIEFRFLCPCEHKVANVRKLIKLVIKHLDAKIEFKRDVVEPNAHSRLFKRVNIARPDLRYVQKLKQMERRLVLDGTVRGAFRVRPWEYNGSNTGYYTSDGVLHDD